MLMPDYDLQVEWLDYAVSNHAIGLRTKVTSNIYLSRYNLLQDTNIWKPTEFNFFGGKNM